MRLREFIRESQQVSTEAMIDYIRKHHDPNLHSDYTNYISNTFTGFELKDIPVNSIKTDLPKLDKAKVEQYKTMDFSKAPPIVVGDGNILDGYHRANVAKSLGIPTIKAYVGVKGVNKSLVEYQGGAWRLIRSMVPRHWPDYVVKDWLYGKIPDNMELEDKKYHIQHLLQEYPVRQWRLEKLPITLDIFTPATQEQIRKREGGSKNPFQVPRDTERHATQAAIIKKQGVSGEPVIMLKKPDGYDLVEGWHRTIQNLQAHPEGYTGPAWVGYL
jgi:hypothetical protein